MVLAQPLLGLKGPTQIHSVGYVTGSGRVPDDCLLQLGHGDGEPRADFYHPLIVGEANLTKIVHGFGSPQCVRSARLDAKVGGERVGEEVEVPCSRQLSLVEADLVFEKRPGRQGKRSQGCALRIRRVAVLVLVRAGEGADQKVWCVISQIGAVQ